MAPMPLPTLVARQRPPADDATDSTSLPTMTTTMFFEFAAETASSTSTTSSSATSATATQSQSSSGGLGSGEGSFYKNLFYILIGLLCAFGIVSFTSLMRARKRRRNIIREAARLGVIVPGQEGYISIRDRVAMTWVRSDGTGDPDWWEINEKRPFSDGNHGSKQQGVASHQAGIVPTPLRGLEEDGSQPDDFYPLSLIPPRAEPARGPSFEPSPLPYFPNHLAYRPDDVIPPPPRFTADNLETLGELAGESVDVITIIRMPGEDWPGHRDNESEEVMREWGGVELGMLKLDVAEAR